MQICHNIKQERKAKKLSQDFVADKLGIPRTTYQSWEKDIEPALSKIKSIAEVLQIPAYVLLKGIIEFSQEPESIQKKSDSSKEPDELLTQILNNQQHQTETLHLIEANLSRLLLSTSSGQLGLLEAEIQHLVDLRDKSNKASAVDQPSGPPAGSSRKKGK